MVTARSTDHVERAIKKVPSAFRGPRTIAILTSWIREKQARESAAHEVGDYAISPDLAFGAGLDQIGSIFLCGRRSYSDDAYRIAIRARGRAYRSGGRSRDLREVAEISAPLSTWTQTDYPPGSQIIYPDVLESEEVLPIAENLAIAKCSGIRLFFAYSLQPTASQLSYRWDSDADVTSRGWSYDVLPAGGRYSDVIDII